MYYIAIYTTTDTDGNQATESQAINATDARTAHTVANVGKPHGATVRVYPDTSTAAGIMRGAVMVARRTAINAIQRQGTPTQYRMEREFAAINARLVGAETTERISSVMAEYSADTQDFFSVALVGLQEGKAAGLDISEQYHGAFLALNKYIHSQRTATEYEASTEFIIDGGGDIVAISTAMSQIIRGGERWTPAAGGTMDSATAARLGQAIAAAMRIVTPTQRKIAEMLAVGYSQRQIAEKTGRAAVTIEKNIAIMRQKIAEYFKESALEFANMIDNSATEAAAKTWKNDGRTDEGKERHKAAHNAEYYREYRARKAAEKANKNK